MAALTLGLPEMRAYVEKRGLPFYDAARLWGTSVLLFGESTCRILDRGTHWELAGYRVRRSPEQTEWLRTRLTGRGLERIEPTTLNLVDDLSQRYDEVVTYMTQPPGERSAKADTSVSRYVEPAFLRGSRGPESWTYSSLASERGSGVNEPFAEVIAGVIGICLAGLGSAADDRLFVLPVPAANRRAPVALGPFLRFTPEVRHRAGGIVGPVALALSVLRQIGDLLPIAEFAYARFGGRGFYESGYLGFGRLLRAWQREMGAPGPRPAQQAILGIASGLWETRTVEDAAATAYARALAMFALEPSPARLEAALRTRVRCAAGGPQDTPATAAVKHRASRIWMHSTEIEGVLKLATSSGTPMPEQVKALAVNVGRALRRVGGDPTARGWVGWYMRLEHSPNRERFFREVERLLTRAIANPGAPMRSSPAGEDAQEQGATESSEPGRPHGGPAPDWWYRGWGPAAGWAVWDQRLEWTGADFRELRNAFLLEVQRELMRGLRRSTNDGETGATEAPGSGEGEEASA